MSKYINNKKLIYSFMLICLSFILYSFENELTNSKLRISLSQNFQERILFFQSFAQQNILVDINNQQFQYFSNVYKEFLAKILSNSTKLSLTLKPFDKIYYNIKTGIITSQSGKFENVETKFDSFNKQGWSVNFNINYSLFPETIVSQSVLFALGINVENYNFNLLSNSNNIFYIDTNFRILDIFCSFSFSKKIKQTIDFFYGVEIIHRLSSMIDNINFYEISGNKYFINLSAGSRIFFTKNEGAFLSFTKSIEQQGDFIFSVGFLLEN